MKTILAITVKENLTQKVFKLFNGSTLLFLVPCHRIFSCRDDHDFATRDRRSSEMATAHTFPLKNSWVRFLGGRVAIEKNDLPKKTPFSATGGRLFFIVTPQLTLLKVMAWCHQ
jgi:hypothetical protein